MLLRKCIDFKKIRPIDLPSPSRQHQDQLVLPFRTRAGLSVEKAKELNLRGESEINLQPGDEDFARKNQEVKQVNIMASDVGMVTVLGKKKKLRYTQTKGVQSAA